MEVITFATVNLNGLTSLTKISMLQQFLRVHDLDIVLLQEVTSTEVFHFYGYTTNLNVGTNMRGTAFLARDGVPFSDMIALPTGRALTAIFRGVLLFNIYAPSRTACRRERDEFYNTEIVPLYGQIVNI
jgi:exonuclease III